MNDAPKLLVEWSSPWEDFVTSIRPALARSGKHLAGETPVGLFPYRGMLASWGAEALILVLLIVIPARLAMLRPYNPPPPPKYDVIYFSGDELPQTKDLGGAEAGRTGRSGGQEAHHRTQTIRVAREYHANDTVVDAPKLNLPRSDSAVANLLAVNKIPGPAPAEGLKSTQRPLALAAPAVPPPPNPIRSGLKAPSLGPASVVPPAPQLAQGTTRSAASMTTTIVAPPPQVTSQVSQGSMRSAPSLTASVVPPPPSGLQHDPFAARVPVVRSMEVVPPPVSAPERDTTLSAKLTLPATAVVAPPPSQVTHQMGTRGGSGMVDLKPNVVPPPVAVGSASGSATGNARSAGGLLGSTSVVPPAVQAGVGTGAGGSARPSTGGMVGTGTVVAPPVQADTGLFSSLRTAVAGVLGGSGSSPTGNVVPPPPTVSNGTGIGGRGLGSKGDGLGGPLDVGSAVAPSNSSGTGNGKGLVVSTQPGSKVGIPGVAGTGSIAMSPGGGDKPGIGGSGGGTGIGKGTGPGGGTYGDSGGSGKVGSGHGAQENAHGGISPYPGPGGAGHEGGGSPPLPGVSVNGGSTITLPSFGGDGSAPSAPTHSSANHDHRGPGITVVGSSRSGGAFNMYGTLKGDKVYTIYLETGAGTAVMQFADPSSTAHPYAEDLSAPEAMRTDVPTGLAKSRLILSCVLDRSGQLRDVRVLEPGNADMTEKVLASLASWKFRPVLRSDQPVEVNAILGFNIDTR
jgi:hypothetical protein